MSANSAASQEVPETMSGGAARMMPTRKRTISKSVKTAATVGPTASVIAPSIPLRDFRTEAAASFELRWEGHWEVWEREWGAPVWIWD
jgi:hypothetical protein